MVNRQKPLITRIAYVIDTIFSPTGGTESQLLRLLENINRNRFEPLLCCLYQSKWMKQSFNLCPVYEIGTNAPLRPSAYPKILRMAVFLRRKKVQVVHTFFRDGNIAGVVSGRLAQVPVIISARRNRGYWHNGRELFILRVVNLLVTRFLANSEDVRRYTHTVEGVPLHKINVIINGLDIDRFRPVTHEEGRKAARDSLGIPRQSLVVAVVANLRQVKGIDVLINALIPIVKRFPNILVLVVGEGEERSNLEGLVASFGLRGFVRFLGTRTDVPEILRASDLGVLPSRSESLSNAIIEYMASGLPVVATDVGGTREMVIHGENGLLVAAGDSEVLGRAMIQVLEDPNTRERMGRCSRELAEEKFSLERCIREHEEYYLKLVAEKASRGLGRQD